MVNISFRVDGYAEPRRTGVLRNRCGDVEVGALRPVRPLAAIRDDAIEALHQVIEIHSVAVEVVALPLAECELRTKLALEDEAGPAVRDIKIPRRVTYS